MQIGPYKLGRELGHGAMGRVSLAVHVPTGVERALKVLDMAPTPDAVVRFKREAEVLARVAGRGVVTVHEVGLDGRTFWYAMDVMPGGSLAARMRARNGMLPWREGVALVSALAKALGRCHAAGVVHRDLKPDNVLFDAAGEPCLADFGCARDLHAARMTETGAIFGTLLYMAPEQLDGRLAGPPADVFALGVILHEIVTGERPFSGETLTEILFAVSHGRARVKPRQPIPRALDRILDRALATDAAKRIQDGAALARELDELLARGDMAEPGRVLKRLGVIVLAGLLLVGGVDLALRLSKLDEPAPMDRMDPKPPPHGARVAPVRSAGTAATSTLSKAAVARLVDGAVRKAKRGWNKGVSLPELIVESAEALDAIAAVRSANVPLTPAQEQTLFGFVHDVMSQAAVGSTPEGVPVYLRLLELDPERPDGGLEAVNYLGQFANQPGVANRLLIEAGRLADDPTVPVESRAEGYSKVARALGTLGRTVEAEHWYKRGLSACPGSPILVIAWTRHLVDADRHGEALNFSEPFVDALDSDERMLLLETRATACMSRNDPEKALAQLRRVHPNVPLRVKGLVLRARAWSAMGQDEAALADLKSAVDGARKIDDRIGVEEAERIAKELKLTLER